MPAELPGAGQSAPLRTGNDGSVYDRVPEPQLRQPEPAGAVDRLKPDHAALRTRSAMADATSGPVRELPASPPLFVLDQFGVLTLARSTLARRLSGEPRIWQ